MTTRKKTKAPKPTIQSKAKGNSSSKSQAKGPLPVHGPGKSRPMFIVTQSSLPSDTEAQVNRALFDRCIQTQGFIRLRLEPRIYDPQSKRYVSLLGESINLSVLSRATMEALLLEIRESLLEEEGRQRGERAS